LLLAKLGWFGMKQILLSFDPTTFLRSFLDDSTARSKMKYKHRVTPEDVSAYLARFSAE